MINLVTISGISHDNSIGSFIKWSHPSLTTLWLRFNANKLTTNPKSGCVTINIGIKSYWEMKSTIVNIMIKILQIGSNSTYAFVDISSHHESTTRIKIVTSLLNINPNNSYLNPNGIILTLTQTLKCEGVNPRVSFHLPWACCGCMSWLCPWVSLWRSRQGFPGHSWSDAIGLCDPIRGKIPVMWSLLLW